MPILFWMSTQLCNYWSNCTIVLTFCHLNSCLCNARAPSRKCCWLTRAQRRSTASRMSSWCPILVTPSSSSSWWVMCSSCSPPICSRSKFFTYCWRQSSRPDEMTEGRVLEHCWLSSVDTVNQGCEWIIHQHTVAFLSLSLFIMLHQFSDDATVCFGVFFKFTILHVLNEALTIFRAAAGLFHFCNMDLNEQELVWADYYQPHYCFTFLITYGFFSYFLIIFQGSPVCSISNIPSLSAIRLDVGIFPWDNIPPSFLQQSILSSSCVTSYENLWRVCGWKPDLVEKVKNHVFCFYYVWLGFVTGAPATKAGWMR